MIRRSAATPAQQEVAVTLPLHRQPRGEQYDPNASSRELLKMATEHTVAWLVIMYVMLLLFRITVGYTPGRAPPIDPSSVVPISPSNVTIVTAYFDVPSKRPFSDYLPWLQRFASLKDNMIIFSSPEMVPLFRQLRKNRPNTHFIGLDLDKARVIQDTPGGWDFWQRQTQLDPEKYIHSKELYVIWNEKGHFLEKAIDQNPFHTDFFAWVDMGYLRDNLLDNNYMIRYIPRELKRKQAMMLDVRALVRDDYLGGGFIGGFKEGILEFTSAYYELLRVNSDRFLGKDQPWMFQTCADHEGRCLMVEARNTYGDAWFYMAPYLHGVSHYGTLDHIRHMAKQSNLYKLYQYIQPRESIDIRLFQKKK